MGIRVSEVSLVLCSVYRTDVDLIRHSERWGVMDYAGGGPVEIGSGVGGLAYAVILGRRKEDQLVNFRCVPSSPAVRVFPYLQFIEPIMSL